MIYQTNLPETAPSDSWHNPKLIIFNANYYKVNERPFMLAHEIGHVVEEVPEFYKLAYLGKEKGEFQPIVLRLTYSLSIVLKMTSGMIITMDLLRLLAFLKISTIF